METIKYLFKKRESFASDVPAEPMGSYIGPLIFSIFLSIFFGLLFCYGAAKLSYSYSIYTGNSSAFFWSVLCFIFPSFYYPYYALMLNPVGGLRTNAMKGGRK